MKKAVKQVIFPSFIKEMCKKCKEGKAFPLGSAASVFATTPSPPMFFVKSKLDLFYLQPYYSHRIMLLLQVLKFFHQKK